MSSSQSEISPLKGESSLSIEKQAPLTIQTVSQLDMNMSSTSNQSEMTPNSVSSSTISAATTPAVSPVTPSGSVNKRSISLSNIKLDSGEQMTRRSSSRSIKRKKFDDEVVESSITYPKQAGRQRAMSTNLTVNIGAKGVTATPSVTPSVSNVIASTPTSAPSTSTSTPISNPINVITPDLPIIQPPQSLSSKKPPAPKPVVTASSKRRRHRNVHNAALKDIGRWKPVDDLSLVIAVQQTCDLDAVYRGVKFSCKFTPQEIEDRWYALLYDPTIAKVSVSAMRQLHPDIIAQVHSKALFSEAEESLLKPIAANSQPSIDTFQDLLNKHPDVFLMHRTAKSLMNHWSQLKHYHLLSDQSIQPLPRHEEVINFSDAEEMMEKESQLVSQQQMGGQMTHHLLSNKDESVHQELLFGDRKTKREIRQLENEIPKWQVLVDSITGVAPSDFDNQTLAVLRGRLVRYLMRSREITLGRCTKESTVDVDLSLEGPAAKISRKQGIIKLQPNGDFMISNTGKRPFYIDSKPVIGGSSCLKLNNNSVVEIAGLRFVFLINQDLIAALRAEALKNQM